MGVLEITFICNRFKVHITCNEVINYSQELSPIAILILIIIIIITLTDL
jgi:hypothetical protein